MFAAFHISSVGPSKICGKPCPPYSSGTGNPIQPASANFLYASLKPGGVATSPSFHVHPSLSPVRFSGSSTPAANAAASSSTESRTSSVSSQPGKAATPSTSGKLPQGELHIADRCTIDAHLSDSPSLEIGTLNFAPADSKPQG